MSSKEYERIWRETNQETAKFKGARRDMVWCRIFNRKIQEAKK